MIVGTLEIAPGADRTADPATWTWTDITARTRTNDVRIERGRSPNAQRPDPGRLDVVLDNGDGALTPHNPESTFYPYIRKGLVVRHRVAAGDPYLELDGTNINYAEAADDASFDITGDIAFAVVLESPLRYGRHALIGRFDSVVGPDESYLFRIDAAGYLQVRWNDGSTIQVENSTVKVPRPDSGPLTVAAQLDVDNGASGYTVTFYAGTATVDEIIADPDAYQLGDPVVGGSTTSVAAGAEPLGVGFVVGSNLDELPGGIREARLINGLLATGTEVANPDFTAETVGATSLTDAAGIDWDFGALTNVRTRFIGELSAQSLAYPGHAVADTAEVRWSIGGVTRRLSQGDPVRSALYRFVTTRDDPIYGYWPGEDGRDATAIATPTDGAQPGRFEGMSPAGDTSLPAADGLFSVSAGAAFYYNMTVGNVTATDWSVTCLVRIPETDSGGTVIVGARTTSQTANLWHVIIDDDSLDIDAWDGSGSQVLNLTGAALPDDLTERWCVLHFQVEQDGSDIDYVAYLTPIGGSTTTTSGTLASATTGRVLRIGTPRQTAPDSGLSIGHWVVRRFTSLGWLRPADDAYRGEPPGERVARLCAEEGIPFVVDAPHGDYDAPAAWSAVFDTYAGTPAMGPQRPAPIIDLLEECATTDQGVLSESRELPGLAYRSGRSLTNQAAQLTLTSEVVQPLRPVDDDQNLVNDATVSRPAGSSARYVDEASVDALERLTADRDANVLSDLHLPDHARWWVHTATPAELRYPTIAVELAKNTAKFVDWLEFNLGDVVAATSLPADHFPASIAQIVEGYTERISPHLWHLELNCTPATPWEVGVRGDDDKGKRDSGFSTLTSSVTDSATTFNVTISAGPFWTTDSGEMPFDIDVSGERITVTAIGGESGGVQSFNITRSVNGVVKAHDAGETVRLWRPTIRAL
ncbi:MAG: hypothetical protein S0880_10305 [Actinomycetota bacterium]|nr:hypothetical protein [Actinomycetota bacterium]